MNDLTWLWADSPRNSGWPWPPSLYQCRLLKRGGITLPVTDALKQAVAAGELDAQIDAAGVELSKKFLKFGR